MILYLMIAVSLVFAFMDICIMKRKSIRGSDGKLDLRGLKPTFRQGICYAAVFITHAALAAVLVLLYQMSVTEVLKHICVTAVLWPAAVIDLKEYRIPNKLVAAGLIMRVALLIPELIMFSDEVIAALLGEGITIVVTAFICVVCMLVSKGGIGMGDTKLALVMASFLGIDGMFNAMFFTLFISFIASIFLLATKRKKKQDAIPFAPFILIGTYLSIIITGY